MMSLVPMAIAIGVATVLAYLTHRSSKEKEKSNTAIVFIVAFIFSYAIVLAFSHNSNDVMKHIKVGDPMF